jgi:nicotinate-nucleotide pyrophosphorylase (carboxylating)
MLMELFAPGASLTAVACDGEGVEAGAVLARVRGPAAEVLALERTLLNLVGRLSGVATLTSRFVAEAAAGGRARVFDTRKTTPGLRVLEKYAVRCGGGGCHRLGLYDAVLVKDNHVGRVPIERLTAHAEAAARRARAARPLRFVEVEADRLEQVEALLRAAPGLIDAVLLDNMPASALVEAVRMRDVLNPGVALEASGGVTLETVRGISGTGVDRISAGALTHRAEWLDVGLDSA